MFLMPKVDWFDKICERLRDYSEGDIWCNCGDEIMCRTESAANAIADMITQLYRTHGEDVVVCTGYYDPEEDKRTNMEDRCTGWWYINLD